MAAGIVGLIVLGLGGGSAFAYSEVKSRADRLQAALTVQLQAGQHELEAGKTSLSQANSKHDATLITQAETHFAAAKTQFQSAAGLADNSRLLNTLESIPAAGYAAYTRHNAVDGIAEMGVALADVGQELSGIYGQLLKPSGGGQAARTLLGVLDQAHDGLLRIGLDLDRAQRAADQVDASLLPVAQQAAFLKAKNTIAAASAGLNEFDRLVPVLKEVLGGNGVRTYLVEQVNPAELRAGGGFIGSYSLLRAEQGVLSVIRSGDSYDLANPRPLPHEPGFIPEPGPLRDVIPAISWSFVDSNEFPDFPTNAQAAMDFVQPRLGKIDAVISIDYYSVAKMLQLTGPVSVAGYGTIDATTFIPQLIQHETDPTHKAVLSALAGPLMTLVTGLPQERWPAIVGALNDLASSRHLQVYATNPMVESEINRVGWSGELNPVAAGDYMMEIDSNYGGGKSNYYLTRHYAVVLTRSGDKLHHRVTIEMSNATPAGAFDLVDYRATGRLLIGMPNSAPANDLRPIISQYLDPPPRMTVIVGWLPVVRCCGGTAAATFEYDTPWPAGAEESHQIYWQKQPGTLDDVVDVDWRDGDGQVYHAKGKLTQDLLITLTKTGVMLAAGHAAKATLPSLALG